MSEALGGDNKFEAVGDLATELDRRWKDMHDPALVKPVRKPRKRRKPPVLVAAVQVDAGLRATLAKHLPSWDEATHPPLFAEALAAVEGRS